MTRRPDEILTLWQLDDLRCELVTRHGPLEYSVRLSNNGRPFVSQRCANPEEGEIIARMLLKMVADEMGPTEP